MQQQIHNREKEQFRKLLKQDHVDDFENRFKVMETFLQTEKHVTSSELLGLLDQKKINLEPEFVRDTLKLMCRYGFAKKNRFNNGAIRYEHLHLGQHHDHMVCTKCNRIFEFEDETLEKYQLKIAKKMGFHLLQHKMELYGICSKCRKAQSDLIPLSLAPEGEQLDIVELTGGSGARMRLMSMGMRIGDRIDIISNSGSGQIVVALDCHRMVLGRGLAAKIMVKTSTQPAGCQNP